MSNTEYVMPAGPVADLGPEVAELVGVPINELSTREVVRFERASEYGQLYVCEYNEETRIWSCDLGHPDSRIELRMPEGTPTEFAVAALGAAAQALV